jgi:hypothetical protein
MSFGLVAVQLGGSKGHALKHKYTKKRIIRRLYRPGRWQASGESRGGGGRGVPGWGGPRAARSTGRDGAPGEDKGGKTGRQAEVGARAGGSAPAANGRIGKEVETHVTFLLLIWVPHGSCRVTSITPLWNPAMSNGFGVCCRHSIPTQLLRRCHSGGTKTPAARNTAMGSVDGERRMSWAGGSGEGGGWARRAGGGSIRRGSVEPLPAAMSRDRPRFCWPITAPLGDRPDRSTTALQTGVVPPKKPTKEPGNPLHS